MKLSAAFIIAAFGSMLVSAADPTAVSSSVAKTSVTSSATTSTSAAGKVPAPTPLDPVEKAKVPTASSQVEKPKIPSPTQVTKPTVSAPADPKVKAPTPPVVPNHNVRPPHPNFWNSGFKPHHPHHPHRPHFPPRPFFGVPPRYGQHNGFRGGVHQRSVTSTQQGGPARNFLGRRPPFGIYPPFGGRRPPFGIPRPPFGGPRRIGATVGNIGNVKRAALGSLWSKLPACQRIACASIYGCCGENRNRFGLFANNGKRSATPEPIMCNPETGVGCGTPLFHNGAVVNYFGPTPKHHAARATNEEKELFGLLARALSEELMI